MDRFPDIKLKDGRTATVSFLSKKDSTREILSFINALIKEKTYLTYDKPFNLKQEEEWKKSELQGQEKHESYILVARVDGKRAGHCGARRGRGKERNNICLGIVVAKAYRSLGLGEGLMRLNIKTAKTFFNPKPKNIYLSIFKPNKIAYSLYKKLGFKEFAVLPKWLLHKGKYVDHILLKL